MKQTLTATCTDKNGTVTQKEMPTTIFKMLNNPLAFECQGDQCIIEEENKVMALLHAYAPFITIIPSAGHTATIAELYKADPLLAEKAVIDNGGVDLIAGIISKMEAYYDEMYRQLEEEEQAKYY